MIVVSILALAFLAGWLALYLFAGKRLVEVKRELTSGTLKPRNWLADIVGVVVFLFLGVSLLAIPAVAIVTFFFMKSGSASGIPLGFAMGLFPVAYLLSELLFAACYTYDPSR